MGQSIRRSFNRSRRHTRDEIRQHAASGQRQALVPAIEAGGPRTLLPAPGYENAQKGRERTIGAERGSRPCRVGDAGERGRRGDHPEPADLEAEPGENPAGVCVQPGHARDGAAARGQRRAKASRPAGKGGPGSHPGERDSTQCTLENGHTVPTVWFSAAVTGRTIIDSPMAIRKLAEIVATPPTRPEMTFIGLRTFQTPVERQVRTESGAAAHADHPAREQAMGC